MGHEHHDNSIKQILINQAVNISEMKLLKLGVIIFGSVWFLSKKSNQTEIFFFE
jgi:glutamyl/glutaminyl-tRNA synthetase